MPLTIRHGDWSATVSDDLERDIRRAVRRAAGDVLDEVEASTDRLYRQARDLMPVQTGRTRDGLRKDVEITTDGQIRGRVTAPRHMRYIRSWQIATDYGRMNEGTVRLLQSRGVGNPRAKQARARRLMQQLGTAGSKAARTGTVRWMLFGWPERAEVEELTKTVGPLIEHALSRDLEDRS